MQYLITSTVFQVVDCGVADMALDKSAHIGRVSAMGWQETNFQSIERPTRLITMSIYNKRKLSLLVSHEKKNLEWESHQFCVP